MTNLSDKASGNEILSESERLKLLIANVTDYAIYMLSPEGIVSSWNPGAERFKGFTADEILGQHFSRFYTDADKEKGLPSLALSTARDVGRFEAEGWRVRKDGSQFWAHVIIDPIKNDAGRLIGFAKITRDITERRDAAQALEKAQQALLHSQKMEAIGKLTGGIAHDFNNLLSVIINGLSVLKIIVTDERCLRMVDSMERASSRGAALTQQLLSFARQQPLKPEIHNVNRIIHSFEAVLRRANKSTVKFELDLQENLPTIKIDAPQFEASLLNLIVNARDATPDGGIVKLRTSAIELDDNEVNQLPRGWYVKVSVIDTGEGMSQEVVERAAEPFFTTKRVGKGTGLGLSQVYGMVQQSNGDMKISSTLGVGTEVSLYFAVEKNRDDSIRNESLERVLVVDDQADVLDMAAELFRTLGYEVLSANSGEDALEILQRSHDIGVLFSDIAMPGIDGVELAKRARAINPSLKVVLTSGFAQRALLEDVELSNFNFITKPYKISDVVKKLRL